MSLSAGNSISWSSVLNDSRRVKRTKWSARVSARHRCETRRPVVLFEYSIECCSSWFSLNGDAPRSSSSMLSNELEPMDVSATKKKKSPVTITMYCTTTTTDSTTQFPHPLDDQQLSPKQKKKKKHKHRSSSSPDKRARRFWQKEGQCVCLCTGVNSSRQRFFFSLFKLILPTKVSTTVKGLR